MICPSDLRTIARALNGEVTGGQVRRPDQDMPDMIEAYR